MMPPIAKGIIFMLIAEAGFSCMWGCVKFSGTHIPFFQIVFFRAFTSVIILGIMMLARGETFHIKNKKLLLLRCIVGTTAMTMAFYALTKTSIGNVATLLHTSPVFVAFLSPLFLKEKPNMHLLVWILLAFVGVMFIVKPNHDIFQNVSVLALIAGLLAGVAYMSIRQLHKTEQTLTITFYFLLFVSLALLPFCLYGYTPPKNIHWVALIGSGIFGTIAQVFLTMAYRCGPANLMTPFTNAAVVFSFLLGWFFWGEIPDIYTLMGASFIVIAIIIISFKLNRKIPIKDDLPRIGER